MSESYSQTLYNQSYGEKYRRSDEEEILSPHHARICSQLGELSQSFGREITALDLGCGTGRYFHCLDRINSLTGVDLSRHMLAQAKHPVKQTEVRVAKIELVCANLSEVRFPPQSFDLIYSLGVLGEFCPLDVGLCNRLYEWLKPGGKLFFSVVDIASRPAGKSFKRRVAEAVVNWLPALVAQHIIQRFSTHYMTEPQLLTVMQQSKFTSYEIRREVTDACYWSGAHFYCLSQK